MTREEHEDRYLGLRADYFWGRRRARAAVFTWLLHVRTQEALRERHELSRAAGLIRRQQSLLMRWRRSVAIIIMRRLRAVAIL
jgi:hypothetical protein